MKRLNIHLLIAIKARYGADEFYSRYQYFLPQLRDKWYVKDLSLIEALNAALEAKITGVYLPIL